MLGKNKIPFLGICFGMQMAIIEFARNNLKIPKATSSEFGQSGKAIVGLINEWNKDGKVIKKILGLQQKNQIENTFKELE